MITAWSNRTHRETSQRVGTANIELFHIWHLTTIAIGMSGTDKQAPNELVITKE